MGGTVCVCVCLQLSGDHTQTEKRRRVREINDGKKDIEKLNTEDRPEDTDEKSLFFQ